MISVPLLGERGVDTVQQVPKSMLTGIIRPRLEETFEMLRDQARSLRRPSWRAAASSSPAAPAS
jgi:cell division ATPase FtsA